MHRHALISLAFVSALSLPLLFQGGLLLPNEAAGATITCNSGLSGCHFNPSVTDGTGRNVPSGQFPGSHAKHSGGAANQYTYACTHCHPSGSYTNSHQTGYKNITGSSLPGTSYNQGKKIPLSFQNNPTFGTCSISYCHSTVQVATGGAGAPTYKITTNWVGGAAMTCTSCHGNNAATLTTGSHVTHLSTTTHATITCANCHSGYEAGTGAAHANAIINIQQSAILGATGTYTDSAGAPGNGFGSCGTSYCHSNVQAANGGARVAGDYKTVTWGSGTLNCGSCHGNTAATLVTGTHAKHLNATYGYTCAACHGTIGGAGNTTIHANQTINIDLTTKGASATYSGDGTPANSNFGVCTATICHGRNSGTWGANVSTQLCTECHGQANTAYPNFSSSIIAPGGSGVDTGGNTAATSARVGAHQTHLLSSSGISDKVHCGECHTVHVAINEGTHLNYTTSTITFGTLAKAQSHTTAAVTRTSGIINCSNTYCHTAKTNTGSALAPAWNDTNYLTATTNLVMADCKKCHNMPPANGDHTGIANLSAFPAATCSCHTNMVSNATTVAGIFTDKNKHVNGIVDVSVDCMSCHGSSKTKTKPSAGTIRKITGVGGDFDRLSRHVSNGSGTENVTKWDCIVCHRAGDATSPTGAVDPALHGNNNGDGLVQLRNVDSPATGWAVNTRAMTETMRTNLDTFCLNCHDADGAKGISVKSTDDGLNYSTSATVARNTTPFNSTDNLRNNRDGMTTRTRVIDVKSQFNPGTYTWNAADANMPTGFTASNYNGNPSQHNVMGPRYFGNNTNWTAATWTNHVTRANQTLNNAAVREKAKLHCSDCHLSESNAHGATNAWYMLMNGTPNDYTGDTVMTSVAATTTASIVCYKCHASTTYTDAAGSALGSRVQHGAIDDNAFTDHAPATDSPKLGANCLNCHGGDGYGRIHGRGNATTDTDSANYTPPGTTSLYSKQRFVPGAWMKWSPVGSNTGTLNDADWNTTVSAKTAGQGCYFAASDNFANCGQHAGGSKDGTSGTVTGYGRPTKY